MPAILDYYVSSSGAYVPELAHVTGDILVSLAGLFSFIAALAGRAGAGGKAFGALFALVYVGVAIYLIYGGVHDFDGYSNDLLLGITYFALFLSWALGRPFRGPGYFGLLLLLFIGVLGALIAFIPGIVSNYAAYLAIEDVVFGLSVWLVVGLSVAFEGKPRGGPNPSAQARPLPTAPFNQRAKFAFAFAMSLIGVEVLSTLSALTSLYFLGYLALTAPVLVILGLVFGHLALAQLQQTGQQGRPHAIVSLVICYGAIVLSLVLVLVQVIALAAISTSYGD